MASRCSAEAILFSSATLPTQWYSSQLSHCQKGMGVPQYRSREMAQSTPFLSHSPNRPSLMYSGYQLILRLLAINCSFMAVVRMYQDSLA